MILEDEDFISDPNPRSNSRIKGFSPAEVAIVERVILELPNVSTHVLVTTLKERLEAASKEDPQVQATHKEAILRTKLYNTRKRMNRSKDIKQELFFVPRNKFHISEEAIIHTAVLESPTATIDELVETVSQRLIASSQLDPTVRTNHCATRLRSMVRLCRPPTAEEAEPLPAAPSPKKSRPPQNKKFAWFRAEVAILDQVVVEFHTAPITNQLAMVKERFAKASESDPSVRTDIVDGRLREKLIKCRVAARKKGLIPQFYKEPENGPVAPTPPTSQVVATGSPQLNSAASLNSEEPQRGQSTKRHGGPELQKDSPQPSGKPLPRFVVVLRDPEARNKQDTLDTVEAMLLARVAKLPKTQN
jgi:hypothetical protein